MNELAFSEDIKLNKRFKMDLRCAHKPTGSSHSENTNPKIWSEAEILMKRLKVNYSENKKPKLQNRTEILMDQSSDQPISHFKKSDPDEPI